MHDIERFEGFDALLGGPVEKFGEDTFGAPTVVAGFVSLRFREEVVVEWTVNRGSRWTFAVRRRVIVDGMGYALSRVHSP